MSPFRDRSEPGSAELHERFAALYVALKNQPEWEHHLYLPAGVLLPAEGEPATLVADTRRCYDALLVSEDIQRKFDLSEVVLIAAVLVRHGDQALPFLTEMHRVQSMFRAQKLRYGAFQEIMGILMLRCALGGAPIQEEHVDRIRRIYLELRRHHWFLTGPEDYCACAMLATRPEYPEKIGQRAEDIYQALRRDTHLGWGERLHTIANLLCLSDLSPEEIALRYARTAEGLKRAGFPASAHFGEQIALMCFVATSIETLVSNLVTLQVELERALAERGLSAGWSSVCSLMFTETVGRTRGPIAETVAFAAMHETVVARRSSDMSMGP